MAKLTYDKPSDVVAEEGRVLVDGPNDVDFAFTPDAARETGGRLIDAAASAESQIIVTDGADEQAIDEPFAD
ncbi:hypothetical protein [Sphingomonas humi]